MQRNYQNLPMADALLLSLARDPTCPAYNEESFARKLRRESSRLPDLVKRACPPGDSYLARREWIAIIARASLTKAQAEVLRLRLAGWNFAQIGAWRGHTKQGSRSIFSQAVQKISAVRNVYPLTGLAEVYRSELKRRSSGGRLVY